MSRTPSELQKIKEIEDRQRREKMIIDIHAEKAKEAILSQAEDIQEQAEDMEAALIQSQQAALVQSQRQTAKAKQKAVQLRRKAELAAKEAALQAQCDLIKDNDKTLDLGLLEHSFDKDQSEKGSQSAASREREPEPSALNSKPIENSSDTHWSSRSVENNVSLVTIPNGGAYTTTTSTSIPITTLGGINTSLYNMNLSRPPISSTSKIHIPDPEVMICNTLSQVSESNSLNTIAGVTPYPSTSNVSPGLLPMSSRESPRAFANHISNAPQPYGGVSYLHSPPRETVNHPRPTINERDAVSDQCSTIGSPDLDPIKLNKEISNILNQSKAIIFSGKEDTEYMRWKENLLSEVKHLSLSPMNWIDLLQRRTSEDALESIKDHIRYLGEIEASKVLNDIWNGLDEQYSSKEKGSEIGFNEIMYGPTIDVDNLPLLKRFASKCSAASKALVRLPTLKSQYDNEITMECIVTRLSPGLRNRWNDWINFKELKDSSGRVSFISFASWISTQNKDARDLNKTLQKRGAGFKTDSRMNVFYC